MVTKTEEPAGDPPPFGHAMLQYFDFEPSYINLNNGSYGSLPSPVLAACEKLARVVEGNPDRFIRFTYKPLLKAVRARIAELVGADVDECVIVPNATHGINTVLRNIEWKHEDVLVGTAVTYTAVSRTIQYLTDVPPHPQKSVFTLRFPISRSEILDGYRAHLKSIPRQAGRKIVAVIDSIVSAPGVLLPWKEMVKICRDEGVISVIDAAHSIGQETNIDLHDADPDFWISNCHKWLYSKRGCAVLYVPKRNQHLIKTTIPTSSQYASPSDPPGGPEPPNFIGQFEWTGTIDPVPFLSVSSALDFRLWIGGEERINEYCHNLALAGGKRLANIFGTQVLDEDGEFTLNMVNVELPLHVEGSSELVLRIKEILQVDWDMSAQIYYHNSKWWVRCSAQIFNEISDFEKLGKALNKICSGIEK